jgi:hypothetical protein
VGELLKASERNTGVRMAGKDSIGDAVVVLPKSAPPTLAELGLTLNLSSLAQHLATSANVARPAGG